MITRPTANSMGFLESPLRTIWRQADKIKGDSLSDNTN
jgi:hypothetical protein